MRNIFIFTVMVVMHGSVCAADADNTLSDETLLAYASSPFDGVENNIVSLGKLNGIQVIAEFICSDVCPDYTVRVIHFEQENDQDCSKVGGVVKELMIPFGIGAAKKSFCFPSVLVENWGIYQKKLSYVPSGVGPHE